MPALEEWNERLLEQLVWHWDNHARTRLASLTDDEYLWEPVPGCWSVRPRHQAIPSALGAGDVVLEYEVPEPQPPPVTTIAWRLAHVIVGCFGRRNAAHFGGPPIDYPTATYTLEAEPALAQLDAGYDRWVAGVRSLGEEGLARPVGPAEGPFAALPYADLVLHINREVIHHLSEVLLLRDLYRQRS